MRCRSASRRNSSFSCTSFIALPDNCQTGSLEPDFASAVNSHHFVHCCMVFMPWNSRLLLLCIRLLESPDANAASRSQAASPQSDDDAEEMELSVRDVGDASRRGLREAAFLRVDAFHLCSLPTRCSPVRLAALRDFEGIVLLEDRPPSKLESQSFDGTAATSLERVRWTLQVVLPVAPADMAICVVPLVELISEPMSGRVKWPESFSVSDNGLLQSVSAVRQGSLMLFVIPPVSCGSVLLPIVLAAEYRCCGESLDRLSTIKAIERKLGEVLM
mmetsp:Transcript_63212/g.113819  ORF Transcript_63212/g.113819 Transcript_63212/m.113819 type:complete len:274 (+) Transcript_63212:196-1017(+)